MKATLAACLAVALPAMAAEPSRLTEKCNTYFANSVVIVGTTNIADAVRNPQQNPELYRHLWEPNSVRETVLFGNLYLTLEYDERQDVIQIADEMKVDPLVRLAGAVDVQKPTLGCFTLPPGPVPMTLTEYHNTILDHYFLSSSAEENAAIDSGGAGPGWHRTGETLSTIKPDYCNGGERVYRFYGPLARSHVFTPDPQECGIVRKAGTGWLYEGVAFGARMPWKGECAPYYKTVWRLYNNRAAQNDPNHRYVTRQALVDEMTARGWVLEGIAFCVTP